MQHQHKKTDAKIKVHHSIFIINLHSTDKYKISLRKQLISNKIDSVEMPPNNVNISENFWFKWTQTQQKTVWIQGCHC